MADAENHTVHAVALPTGAVTTIADTGYQARRSNEAGVGRSVALSSPWDLEPLPAGPRAAAASGTAPDLAPLLAALGLVTLR